MYHRFVLADPRPHPENPGIFPAAIAIWKSFEGAGETPEQQALHNLMHKFNHHLQVPKKIPQHGRFWFKDGSVCIEFGKEICLVLRKFGVETVHYQSDDPGEIVFEDKHQVVAKMKRRTKARKVELLEV